MFFKKKKLPVQKERSYKTPLFLSMIGIALIIGLGVFSVKAIDSIEFKVFEFTNNTGSTLNPPLTLSGGLIEEGDNKNTYILITGRGGGDHDAPDLTDTIILAGINFESETITLFSLPRDLWVEYPGTNISGKINGIYESNVPLGRDVAIEKLGEKVTEITGKNIDYYMNVDFDGFVKVVDILGGVEVTLNENFVDYEYPAGPGRYKTFILRKGTWTLDGEVALMYARSRHSTSDFDRSLRQQEIISSLREKVGELGYFKDSKTILNLYGAFSDYVETDLSVGDMISLGLKIRGWENTETLSFNLNDTCYEGSPSCSSGGFLYVPLREYFGGASVLLPKKSIAVKPSYYTDIKKFSSLIFNAPEIYSSPVKIQIHNASGIGGLAASFASDISQYGIPINAEEDLKTLRELGADSSVIYFNGIEKNNPTLMFLESLTDFDIIETTIPKYSDAETKIEIILLENNSF